MLLTPRDAARLLGVSDAMLHRWLRSGELNSSRVGEQYRLNRVDVLEFAAARNLPVSPELLAELSGQAQAPTSLADAVRAGGVHAGIAGKDKAEILRAIVDRLPLPSAVDRDLLHRVLLAREALGSTALGQGIAIPHARNPIVLHVERPLVAICYLERPADFDALDGQPVHTLVTLVSSSTRMHLHLLAVLAAALHEPAVRAALEARAGVDAVVAELARVEAELAARRSGAPNP